MPGAAGITGGAKLTSCARRCPQRCEQPEDTSRTRILRQLFHIDPCEAPSLIVHRIGIVLQIRHVKNGTIPEAKLLLLVLPFCGTPVHLTGNIYGVLQVLAGAAYHQALRGRAPVPVSYTHLRAHE